MFLKPFEINKKSPVAEIVAKDYRTADVFRKYGIGYCCGGKWPVDIACEMQGADADKVQAELETAIRTVQLPGLTDFTEWDMDFLISYIINVHHSYLKKSLPLTQKVLTDFAEEHRNKFSWVTEAEELFESLIKQILPALLGEEESVFPYLRRINHAHRSKEPYAALLVRTLRKPLEQTLFKSHDAVSGIVFSIRRLTNSYTSPEKACISHKVILHKLNELDNDLMQHFWLEQSVLFPRAVVIEKDLLDT